MAIEPARNFQLNPFGNNPLSTFDALLLATVVVGVVEKFFPSSLWYNADVLEEVGQDIKKQSGGNSTFHDCIENCKKVFVGAVAACSFAPNQGLRAAAFRAAPVVVVGCFPVCCAGKTVARWKH